MRNMGIPSINVFFFIATFDYWGDVNQSILNCIERDQHGNIKSCMAL